MKVNFHIEDFPKFLKWVFGPLLKLTHYSKHPTDVELDELKQKISWILLPLCQQIVLLIKLQIKWFFKHKWKFFILKVLVVFSIMFGSYLTVGIIIDLYNKQFQIIEIPVEKTIYTRELKSFEEFVKDVVMRENSGRWTTREGSTTWGGFQFKEKTLVEYVGIRINKEDFENNIELQIGAFKYFLLKNNRTYNSYVQKWRYKTIKNVRGTLTESGILMSFHLRPESAKVFFNSNGENLGKPDGNGIYVNEYIELFNGYELKFLK